MGLLRGLIQLFRTYFRNIPAMDCLREESGSLNYLCPFENLCCLGNCVDRKSPVSYQLTAFDFAVVEVECEFPVPYQLTAFARFVVAVARSWLASQ